MKIVTPTNILLDQNIIALYTNVERFIDSIDRYMDNEMYVLNLNPKDRAKIQSLLPLDNIPKKEQSFLGVFYSVDPYTDEIDVWWTTLKGAENYLMLLKAIGNDDLFISDDSTNEVLGDDSEMVTTLYNAPLEDDENYDFAEDEYDEYDEEENEEDDLELELEVLDAYLENWDENDG